VNLKTLDKEVDRSVIPENAEDHVGRAIKAVQKAHDAFQALQTSHNSTIPLSMLEASTALDKLMCKLSPLTGTAEGLAVSLTLTDRGALISSRTSLFDALKHDMEAMATRLRCMLHPNPAETPGALDTIECRDITDLVDRYDRSLSSVLTQHNV
jgi:hypothetical protein